MAGALDAAVAAGGCVVEDGDEVRFAHPLLASPLRTAGSRPHAGAACTGRRPRLSHGAEDRARHLALAVTRRPTQQSLALLEEAAGLAGARGAPEAGAERAGRSRRASERREKTWRGGCAG